MKVHLIKNEESLIKGYKPVYYSASLKLNNLSSLSDNECEFILASEVFDEFSQQEMPNVIQQLAKKLRMNGMLVIGGTDIRIFAKSIVNGSMSEQDASEMIRTRQSMSNINDVLKIVQSLGLKIQASQIIGNHYEVTAIRN